MKNVAPQPRHVSGSVWLADHKAGEPVEPHADQYGSTQTFAFQGKDEGGDGHQQLGFSNLQAAGSLIGEKDGGKEGGEDGHRDQTQPVDEPLGHFPMGQVEEGEPAGDVGNKAHAAKEKEVVDKSHRRFSR